MKILFNWEKGGGGKMFWPPKKLKITKKLKNNKKEIVSNIFNFRGLAALKLKARDWTVLFWFLETILSQS